VQYLDAEETLRKKNESYRDKKVMLNDIDQLQKIGRQTFYQTFSAGNSEENMKKYSDEGFSIEKLTTKLSDKNAEFYFATLGDNVVGYLKLNFGQSQTELQDDKTINIARQKSVNYTRLGVWEENLRAINLYKKTVS